MDIEERERGEREEKEIRVREGNTLFELVSQISSDTHIYGVKNESQVVIFHKSHVPKLSKTSQQTYHLGKTTFCFNQDLKPYFREISFTRNGKTSKFPYFNRETTLS